MDMEGDVLLSIINRDMYSKGRDSCDPFEMHAIGMISSENDWAAYGEKATVSNRVVDCRFNHRGKPAISGLCPAKSPRSGMNCAYDGIGNGRCTTFLSDSSAARYIRPAV